MKIAIFGATGGTGRLVVEQALEAGHEVIAFVRDPSKLNLKHEHLTVVQGDVTDLAPVERAVNGADAVISVLNTRGESKSKPITRGAQNILRAMAQHGVRRLVFSAAPSAADPHDAPDLRFRLMTALVRLVARAAQEDLISSVEAVRASDTDWTIVRLPFPTDDPKTGRVQVGYVNREIGMRISRADAAEFMLKEVQEAKYVRQAPLIAN